VDDASIIASSMKNTAIHDARMNKMPGKPAPTGWIASTPDKASSNFVPNEWIQVSKNSVLLKSKKMLYMKQYQPLEMNPFLFIISNDQRQKYEKFGQLSRLAVPEVSQ